MSESAATERMAEDDVYEAFRTNRRRRVVDVLCRDGGTTLGELATQIAAWENDVSMQELEAQQRSRVYIALYQRQLKILEEARVVDWNKARGTVECGPAFENAVEILVRVRELCGEGVQEGSR